MKNINFEQWKKISPLPCLDLTKYETEGIFSVGASYHIYDKNTICVLTAKQLGEFTKRKSRLLDLTLGRNSIHACGYLEYHGVIVPCLTVSYADPKAYSYHFIVHGTENGSGVASSRLKGRFGSGGSLIRKVKLSGPVEEEFMPLLKYVINNNHLNKSNPRK